METLEGIINELRTNLHQNNAELQKALIDKQISDSDARTAFLELNTLQEKFSIIKFEESDMKKNKKISNSLKSSVNSIGANCNTSDDSFFNLRESLNKKQNELNQCSTIKNINKFD